MTSPKIVAFVLASAVLSTYASAQIVVEAQQTPAQQAEREAAAIDEAPILISTPNRQDDDAATTSQETGPTPMTIQEYGYTYVIESDTARRDASDEDIRAIEEEAAIARAEDCAMERPIAHNCPSAR